MLGKSLNLIGMCKEGKVNLEVTVVRMQYYTKCARDLSSADHRQFNSIITITYQDKGKVSRHWKEGKAQNALNRIAARKNCSWSHSDHG